MIKEGDAVQVKAVHCEKAAHELGYVFTVGGVDQSSLFGHCPHCGAYMYLDSAFAKNAEADCGYPVAWLRKLDGLTADEQAKEARQALEDLNAADSLNLEGTKA